VLINFLDRNNSSNIFSVWDPWSIAKRYYPAPVKRFYLNASVAKGETGYEIHLDRKPLKTPSRKHLTIKNEKLANAVAAEWGSQKNVIAPNIMHLTALCNTVQDNPLRKTKDDLIGAVLAGLDMDTILYRSDDNEKLMELQKEKWDPIYNWFKDYFQVEVPLASGISPPEIPQETLDKIRDFLDSNNFEAVQGFVFGMDSIRSVILTTATVLNKITPKEAVHLSRLELEYQTSRWGTVEWHHEVELFDSIARLSAATLFFDSHA